MYRLSFVLAFLLEAMVMMAQNPHGQNLKIDCKACHNTNGWKINYSELNFNHDTLAFALDGQHQSTSCIECHSTLVFEDAESNCISCHTDVHNMSVGDDCVRCHSTSNWLVDNIPELHEQNGFPLTGPHDALSCLECHKSTSALQWNRIGNECQDCHLDDYHSATEPDHLAAGFSTNCLECHSPFSMDWSTEGFHLFFPLEGAHDIHNCTECHFGNNYTATSPECFSCHQDDYDNTTNPDHRASGFSTNCAECHTTATAGWGAGNFHFFFPLEGGHDIADCNACHNGNDYTSADPQCFSCHQDDYNSATLDHQSAGFGTDCASCHSINGWRPANIDHDAWFFPIYSGKHDGEWNNCVDCHLNAGSGDYSTFSCIDCHEHNNVGRLANKHDEVSGYVYQSSACYACHPKGNE